MKSRDQKVNKNVTLTMVNVEVIMQMMDKSRKNFSQSLNLIMDDWIRLRVSKSAEIKKAKLIQEVDQINKATVIRE